MISEIDNILEEELKQFDPISNVVLNVEKKVAAEFSPTENIIAEKARLLEIKRKYRVDLRRCHNSKNVSRSKQNTILSEKRKLLRAKIAEIDMNLEEIEERLKPKDKKDSKTEKQDDNYETTQGVTIPNF